MGIYDANGTQLNAIYDANGTELSIAYDANGNVIYRKESAKILVGDYSEAIGDLSDWLINKATYTANGNTYCKERYRMDTNAWVNGATAIAMGEIAVTYLQLWKYHNDTSYRTTARNIVSALEAGRRSSNGFSMYVYGGSDTTQYTGGNSEVPLMLFRCAEIDADYASTYIASALTSTDFLLGIQNSDGSWRTSSTNQAKTAMFTAQAVGALSAGYQYTANKSAYLTAVQKGIAYIQTQLMSDGRIKTSHDNGSTEEWWRPPTSDQAIVIRGLAIAEYYLSSFTDVSSWRMLRHTLLTYLNQCIGAEGSVRNGLGNSGLPNDYYGLTDHVYTTSWAIEAYYYSGLVDSSGEELNTAKKILDFCKGNLYFSEDANTNGTIRGAYNVQDGNWDTSALIQDGGNEGGAEMIYVGWVMAPIVTWMITYQSPYDGNSFALFGNSITYWDQRPAWYDESVTVVGYPTYLRNDLGVTTDNFGVAGAQTSSICNTFKSKNLALYDCAILTGGTNDANNNISVSTYKSSLVSAIQYAQTSNPNLKLFLVSPPKMFGTHASKDVTPYCEAMEEVAEQYNLPCLRMDEELPFTDSNYQQYLVDEIHPNNVGYEIYANTLMRFLIDNY